MSFDSFGFSKEVLKAIEALSFVEPSPIQASAIPTLLNNEVDMVGLAQTGTGKTAAFGLPLVEKLDAFSPYTEGLIMAPTRELGQQIADQISKFSKFKKGIDSLAVYGGTSIVPQIKTLKKNPSIVIATPGRLLDLIKRKAINLKHIKYVILDEADEMLNMGFKEDIDNILASCPDEKKVWLFSATMPREIERLVADYMENPERVQIKSDEKVNVNITHQYVELRSKDKLEALKRFIDIVPGMRGVVFCRTKMDAQELSERLLKQKYQVDAIHGDLSQNQRDRVMDRFRSKAIQLLIATDVAARGIDVNDLTHVFHYRLPDDVPYYTHRSGRTARAGKKGVSIAFINHKDYFKIRKIEKTLKIKFEQVTPPSMAEVMDSRAEKWAEEILSAPSKSKLPEHIIEKVQMLTSSLSKEELIRKVLTQEFSNWNLDGKPQEDFRRSDRGDRGDRGGRGGGRRRSGRDGRKSKRTGNFFKDGKRGGKKYKGKKKDKKGRFSS